MEAESPEGVVSEAGQDYSPGGIRRGSLSPSKVNLHNYERLYAIVKIFTIKYMFFLSV
jgi:hypothetical protein